MTLDKCYDFGYLAKMFLYDAIHVFSHSATVWVTCYQIKEHPVTFPAKWCSTHVQYFEILYMRHIQSIDSGPYWNLWDPVILDKLNFNHKYRISCSEAWPFPLWYATEFHKVQRPVSRRNMKRFPALTSRRRHIVVSDLAQNKYLMKAQILSESSVIEKPWKSLSTLHWHWVHICLSGKNLYHQKGS